MSAQPARRLNREPLGVRLYSGVTTMVRNGIIEKRAEEIRRITILLIMFGLLFLRLPFLAGIALVITPTPEWLSTTFEFGTYILTILLIWIERKRLIDFHIDRLALFIIIFFKPIETLILENTGGTSKFPLAFPNIPAIIIWAVSFIFLIALLFQRPNLPKIDKKSIAWFLLGLGIGFITAIILAFPNTLQLSSTANAGEKPIFDLYQIFVLGIGYQFGFAAISEEPLFRGFLWGYLRKAGWNEVIIWIFQAFLFWIGHIFYFGKMVVSFWIIVPIGGLLLGLLAWKSRSIATSMAAHAVVNGLTYIFTFWLLFLLK
jgi:membrane protease YdiL (CAAX protease family)